MPEKAFTAESHADPTAYVVLVVEDELLERVSTVMHLRKSGFDVIEAEDGDEARRVLDAVYVDVVLANLATSGQTNGLALLRWLHERHPAIKTILTSGTETNMTAVNGYGIFLSKPYRLVDLDYCLQKVLATVNIPASQTGGAMIADGTQTGLGSSKARPGSAGPNRAPAPYKTDGRDEIVKPSMAELSRRLGERAARQRAVDPVAAAEARRTALRAYDRARKRRLIVVAGVAVAAVAAAGIAYFVPTADSSVAASTSDLARTEPDSSLSTASVAPVSVTASQQVPVEPALSQAPLRRDEVREVQARLRSFGFRPGPIDGVPGPMTEDAVMRYQQDRGQPQTGKVDGQLLEQLRQDPALQIAQRAPRSPGARRSDPFEPVRAAGNRLERITDALTHRRRRASSNLFGESWLKPIPATALETHPPRADKRGQKPAA